MLSILSKNSLKKYFLLTLIFLSFGIVKAQLNATDRAALIALYSATDGANWTTPWDTTQVETTWAGVTIVNDSVTILNLASNNLVGVFPIEISTFTKIQDINLSNNSLSGTLSSGLGVLVNLVSLDLSNNQLNSPIPIDLGLLLNLTTLRLNNNQLISTLPAEIGNILTLVSLEIQDNLMSGSIPIEITNLTSLTVFNIFNNSFVDLPDLSGMINLSDLQVYSNFLTFEDLEPNIGIIGILYSPQNQIFGTGPYNLTEGDPLTINIPVGGVNNIYQWQKDGIDIAGETADSIFMASTTVVDAGTYTLNVTNSVVGGITISTEPMAVTVVPPYFGVPATDSLALVAIYNATNGPSWNNSTNWLVGNVNTWFGVTVTNDSVSRISLGGNNLTGTLPPDIGNFQSLTYLVVNSNSISGGIPPEIGLLAKLDTISLSYNGFSGSIPVEFYNLSNLIRWSMSNCQLDGTLAPEIGNLINLKHIALWNNPLTGDIPAEFWNLTQMEKIYLGTSGMGGAISPNIGNFSNLLEFWISDCNLSGVIPPEIGNATSLQLFDVSNTNLTGALPAELGNLINLVTLKLGNNLFTGNIPPELAAIATLQTLIMHQNQLSGSIPLELGNLTNLLTLVLHSNQLSGSLPTELGNLTQLVDFQINNNLLSGAVPPSFANLINLQFFYLQSNQLTDLPDFSALPINGFGANDNFFTFEDLESNAAFPNSNYTPQANVSSSPSLILNAGDTIDVASFVGGSANVYQWFLDNNPLPNDTLATLVKNGVVGTDLGTYQLQVTNPLVPGLTIFSDPFTVSYNVASNDCATAEIAIMGNNTTPKAPYWFTYTASQPEIINITSAGVGAVLRVYSDCSLANNLGGNGLFLNPNESIRILWDSISSPAGFNWVFESRVAQSILAADSIALVALYNSTEGQNWTVNSNWLTGWVESWYGVNTNLGRVEKLLFQGNNLKGSVPVDLLNLDSLNEINFDSNLIDNIPDFTQIISLDTLFLSSNFLEFDDLEPLLAGGTIDTLNYSPQRAFGDAQHKILKIGDAINLTFVVPGTNPSLMWERDFVPLLNETLNTFSIANFQDTLAGAYSLRATSVLVPGLELISNKITLELDSTTVNNTTYFEWVTTGPIAEDIPQNSYGSTWIDYDNDGDEDLYVNHWLGTITEPNYLYQNNGDGTFTKITTGAIANVFATRFVSWGDYNNDNMVDMLCHFNNGAQLVLYRNEGAGVFTEIILRNNISGKGAIWGDVNNDGNLDIIHSSWQSTEILLGDGAGVFNSTGTFTAQFSDGNIQVIDIDNDGDIDISMAGFGTTDNKAYLFINDGTGVFTEQVIKNLTNMLAVSWADIDNDGDMDSFIADRSGAGEGYFMINDGTGVLDSIPMQDRLGEAFSTRATTFGDINNDGFIDLIAYNSNLGTTALFLNNQDGSFTRVASSEQLFGNLRAFAGASLADYDNDGALDLIMQEFGESNNELYHNKGNVNNWLKLKLVGTYSNTNGIGARVVANAGVLSMTRQVQTMTGFTSSNSMIVHYGLAAETTADITIYWPSGIVQTIAGVAANQMLEVVEDCASPLTWYADPDGDGQGDSEISLVSCVQPNGYVDNADDLRLSYYWIGDGGNWIDITHWSNTSGGPADQANIPDLNDSVYFDANSFSTAGQVVVVTDNGDRVGVEFGTMDWSQVSNFPTFQIKAVTSDWLESYTHGSLIFSQDMILDFYHAEFYFGSIDDYVLDTKGLFMGEDSFLDFGYDFGGSQTTNNTRCDVVSDLNNVLVYLNKGQLHANGNTIKGQKNHYFWIRGDSVLMDVSNSYVEFGQFNKTALSSTLIANNTQFKAYTEVSGENLHFENLVVSDSVEFKFYDYQIDTLEILSGAVVTLDTGITVSTNKLAAVGTATNPIIIQSSVAGTQATISAVSGVVDAFYLNVIDNNATGGATFNAYRSTDNGNNSGWSFLSASVADSIALTAFYNGAIGADWTDNTGWTTGPVSSWFGVGINGANVASVILPNNNLQGIVAPELATIPTLERLDLSGNFLESLPDLTGLPALDTLDVSGNNLDFASLEANSAIIEVDYTDQGEIGAKIDTVVYVGERFKLVAESAGINNTYQWRKIIASGDTIDLVGKTSNTLYLDSLNRQTMGRFVCEIKNTLVTDLILKTDSLQVLAGADIIGLVKDTNDQVLDSGRVTLYKVNKGAAFDITAVFDLVPGDGGTFSFPKTVLADYIFLANIDTLVFVDVLPTYWSSTIFWEEADTLLLNDKETTIEILVAATPPDDPGGNGAIFGSVFEDLPTNGRIAARRKLPKASVSVRKKRGSSKGTEDTPIFDLVGYVITDENGDYKMEGLTPGVYRFNVQYPGIPMDTVNSNIDIEVTDNGAQQTNQVIATVTEEGILLETSPLGIYRSNYKRWVEVYPVPSNNRIFIQLDQYRNVEVMLTISSITGRRISVEKRLLSPDNPAPLELDIQGLESGVYILDIKSTRNVGDGPLVWKTRFIKKD